MGGTVAKTYGVPLGPCFCLEFRFNNPLKQIELGVGAAFTALDRVTACTLVASALVLTVTLYYRKQKSNSI